ncbi:serine hydrolase domain-containing protein [Thermopirellula anaerolimosa]
MKHSRRTRGRLVLSFVAVFLAVGVCVSHAAESGRCLPEGNPREVGMDPATLAKIPSAMERFVEAKEISGAVTMVVSKGRIVHHEAVGLADIEQQIPMAKDTLFGIASMTKPISATALMILVDQGKVALDDPVVKYLPEFADLKIGGKLPEHQVTVRHLLSHTSGFSGSQRTEETLEKTVAAIVAGGLSSEPGTRWAYSPGMTVCGRIVEVVSGRPFDRFLQENIFTPLQMNDTTFQPTPEQRKRTAKVYRKSDGGDALQPFASWIVDDAGIRAPNPSAGLFSTANDLARFYQMILSGGELCGTRILSSKAVAEMLRIQTGEFTVGFTPGNAWGLGWCIVREPQGVTQMLSPGTFGHGGAFGTQGWIDPQREMIFILLIQRAGLPNADESDVRKTFQEIAVQAILE